MNGVIVLNKPPGLSSREACLQVKRRLGFKKAGHLGTLDPLATGVLPLCINEGTKLVQFLSNSEKEYVAILQLGSETDTQDSQGKIIKQTDIIPQNTDRIRNVFKEFNGELLQTPPMYSALKRNGIPLYKIARRGGWVQREQRKIIVYEIEVLQIELPYITFRVVCSQGTYIRTLCRDIGRRLLSCAHLTSLERTRNGAFHISQSVKMEDIEALHRTDLIEKHLILPKDALKGMQEIVVGATMENMIENGVQITIKDVSGFDLPKVNIGQHIKIISSKGSLIGVVESLITKEMCLSCNPDMKAWRTVRGFLAN